MREIRQQPAAQAGFIAGWPSYLMTLIVIAAAAWSFAPRSYPPAPETRVHPKDLLVTAVAHRGSRWIAGGEQGRILISDRHDGDWREAKVEPQRGSNINDVLFVSDDIALAVGHESWILRSEDGGKSWKEVLFDAERSEPLLALAGPFKGVLIAVGGFGQYLSSTDRGASWQRATHEALSDFHLNSLTQLGDGSLLIAGERGLLALSGDNGVSWTRLPEIYPGSFFGAIALKDNGLLVFGMRGNVFVTQDRANWSKAELPGIISLFGGVLDDDGNIVLVGENDTVLRSRDGGKHFQKVHGGDRGRLTAVLPVEGEGWLVTGEAGVGVRKPDAAAAEES